MPYRFLVALPVFNEARHLTMVLDEVQKYCSEILVVDDGSSDSTPQILKAYRKRHPFVHVVTHPFNTGYGAALNSAFQYAITHEYDALVTIDCDGQHEPALIPNLVSELQSPSNCDFDIQPQVDIVSGSRYLRASPGDSTPPEDRRSINLQITQKLNQCLNLNLTDAFCGFKAYRVESLSKFNITELGYAMPLQLWVQAVAQNLQIVEFPVPLIYLEEKRSFGGSLDDSRKRMAYYKSVLEQELSRQTQLLSC